MGAYYFNRPLKLESIIFQGTGNVISRYTSVSQHNTALKYDGHIANRAGQRFFDERPPLAISYQFNPTDFGNLPRCHVSLILHAVAYCPTAVHA